MVETMFFLRFDRTFTRGVEPVCSLAENALKCMCLNPISARCQGKKGIRHGKITNIFWMCKGKRGIFLIFLKKRGNGGGKGLGMSYSGGRASPAGCAEHEVPPTSICLTLKRSRAPSAEGAAENCGVHESNGKREIEREDEKTSGRGGIEESRNREIFNRLGHRALDGWHGRDVHAPSADVGAR